MDLWILYTSRIASKRTETAVRNKKSNPIGSLLHLRKYDTITGLIRSMVLIYIAGHAAQSTWMYYTMLKFSWNEEWVGYSLAFIGLLIALVQGGLIRIAIPKLGVKNAVYVGLTLYVVGFTLFAFASIGWMVFAFMIPYCLGRISGPALQGIMSTQVPANEQGELQGALTGRISLTSIVGPILMTHLFSFFTKTGSPIYFPGAPFLMGRGPNRFLAFCFLLVC